MIVGKSFDIEWGVLSEIDNITYATSLMIIELSEWLLFNGRWS